VVQGCPITCTVHLSTARRILRQARWVIQENTAAAVGQTRQTNAAWSPLSGSYWTALHWSSFVLFSSSIRRLSSSALLEASSIVRESSSPAVATNSSLKESDSHDLRVHSTRCSSNAACISATLSAPFVFSASSSSRSPTRTASHASSSSLADSKSTSLASKSINCCFDSASSNWASSSFFR
ncbi:hypothetical protein V565_271170, partial [Rhizoctonia solani 123E]